MTDRKAPATTNTITKVNAFDIASKISKHWSPTTCVMVDQHCLKIAKIKGSFQWHQHQNEDELFWVLEGGMTMHLENQASIAMTQGDMLVVPAGTQHCPEAEQECTIALFEKTSTQQYGDA